MTDGATPWRRGRSFQKFLETLPDILAGQTFKAVVSAIVTARQRGKPVILGMGAHPTKVGLNPILVDLMRKDVITAVAMNGAVVIHDFELAYQGRTSEEVEAEIDSGRFGMCKAVRFCQHEINMIFHGSWKGWGLVKSVCHHCNYRIVNQFISLSFHIYKSMIIPVKLFMLNLPHS